MNEIEKAIENLQERKLVMSQCIDKQYCEEQNRSIDLAIEALQEKYERENLNPLTFEELKEYVGKPFFYTRN